MNVAEIAAHIEALCPREFAGNWDNVGLLVGDSNQQVQTVMVTLDVDEFVVAEAAQQGVDLIVSHHPLMFEPVQQMTEHDPVQKTVRRLVANGISFYAAHTNLDVARGGLNDKMADMLGLADTRVLDVTVERDGIQHGFGRYTDLKTAVTLRQMLDRCKTVFGISGVKYCGDLEKTITRVAINTGGGTSIIDRCYENNVELFITGDFKYSVVRGAYERGMCVIDAGHYDTEIIAQDFFFDYLKPKFPQLRYIKSEANKRVFETYI